MNKREFAAIFQKVQAHYFNAPIPATAIDVYYSELAEFPAEHVSAAIDAIIRAGSPHIPLAGMIRRKIVELTIDAPPWSRALPALAEARRKLDEFRAPASCLDGNPGCDGDGTQLVEEDGREFARFCSCREKLREMRATDLHPLVREFVEIVGWATVERAILGDTTVEAQTRRKYEEHVAAAIEGRSLQGIEAPSLRRIARVGEESRELASISGSVAEALPALPAPV